MKTALAILIFSFYGFGQMFSELNPNYALLPKYATSSLPLENVPTGALVYNATLNTTQYFNGLVWLSDKQIKPTLFTKGKYLYSPDGQKLVLKGVNFGVLDDWQFPSRDLIPEIAQSNASTIRIQWWISYPSRPAFSLSDLDRLLTKCKLKGIVPILSIGDLTCHSDMAELTTIAMPWWLSADVLKIIEKHKSYLIINLANELGNYRWNGYGVSYKNAFLNTYKSAISDLRNAGVDVPIMIDGTDCGTDIRIFNEVGSTLIDHDPLKNLIFDVHAYWEDYASEGLSQLNTAIANNLPLFFGEISNYQDGTSACQYNLADNVGFRYQDLLAVLKTNQIGWAAWSWVRDGCLRNLSNNDLNHPNFGKYAGLTAFGVDIVQNPAYGLQINNPKPQYLKQ